MKLPASHRHHVPGRIAVAPIGWLLCAALLGSLQSCSMASRMFDTHASTDTVRNAPPPPVLVPDTPATSGAAAIPAAAPAEPDRPAAVATATPPVVPPATPPGAFVNEKAAAIAARGPVSERPTATATGDDPALLPGNTDLPKGRWAARIGLFGVEANAYRQAATLRDAMASHPDLPAEQRVVRVVKTGERYIVLLGDLADVQSARQLVSKVRQILHQDAIIYTR
ncbi:MAG: SPOR domain-containing protein [Leptothrix sp. (in: b-proteobacteria)]